MFVQPNFNSAVVLLDNTAELIYQSGLGAQDASEFLRRFPEQGRYPYANASTPWTLLGQGVEIYYNLALTPWLHVTADMQTIDPATAENNTALMGSLRIGITL